MTLSAEQGIVTLRATLEVPGEDAVTVALLDEFNRGLPLISDGDGDTNLDLEHMATFDRPHPGRVEVLIRLFENALPGERLKPFLGDVIRGIADLKRRLKVRDPIDWVGLETRLGIKPGPLVRAMAERHAALKESYSTPAWPEALFPPRWLKPELSFLTPVRRESPWGRLLPFAQVVDAEELPRQFEAMLVVRGDEGDSDGCAVVCLEPLGEDAPHDPPREAIWVAPSLGAFLSLLALGSTGARVHDRESAAFAWMRFYDYAARSERRNLAFVEWLSGNGVDPCDDPLRVVTPPPGTPRRATTTVIR